jgi:hypothetical protein
MARNGSGSYSLPANSWNPATPDTPILSDDWNQTADDIAQAISGSLASDGQTTATVRIPFAQGASVQSGTISNLGLSIIGDTNTGVYSPAADQFSIVCGGVAALSATSSGINFPGTVTFSGSPTISGNLTLSGNLTVNGNTTIGNASGDTLSVVATGTFTGNQTFNGTTTFASTITVPDASFTNAKLASVATQTFKGRATAGTGAPEDLTVTQATALLNAMVGDSGSGGTKGLVPAAAAGDAAKQLYLNAGGTFSNELKAWGVFNGGTGATISARGVTCVRNSASNFTLTFSPALANADYCVVIQPQSAGGEYFFSPSVTTKNTTTLVIQTLALVGGTPGGADPLYLNIQVFG